MKKMQALGLIETYGWIGAVEALDIAAKTAYIELLGIEQIGSGLVTIQITGDVAAVKASVDAAVIGANKVSKVISGHVIPRPFDDLSVILQGVSDENTSRKEEKKEIEEIQEIQEIQIKLEQLQTDEGLNENEIEESEEPEDTQQSVQVKQSQENKIRFQVVEQKRMKISNVDFKVYEKEQLEEMRVVDLRTLFRSLPNITIERSKIKFMNKQELLDAIQEIYKLHQDTEE